MAVRNWLEVLLGGIKTFFVDGVEVDEEGLETVDIVGASATVETLSDGRKILRITPAGGGGSVADGSLTPAKFADQVQGFFGRLASGTGVPSWMTPTQATTLLDIATTSLKGLLSAADKTKLDGIATAATANAAGSASPTTVGTAAASAGAATAFAREDHRHALDATAATQVELEAQATAIAVVTSDHETRLDTIEAAGSGLSNPQATTNQVWNESAKNTLNATTESEVNTPLFDCNATTFDADGTTCTLDYTTSCSITSPTIALTASGGASIYAQGGVILGSFGSGVDLRPTTEASISEYLTGQARKRFRIPDQTATTNATPTPLYLVASTSRLTTCKVTVNAKDDQTPPRTKSWVFYVRNILASGAARIEGISAADECISADTALAAAFLDVDTSGATWMVNAVGIAATNITWTTNVEADL